MTRADDQLGRALGATLLVGDAALLVLIALNCVWELVRHERRKAEFAEWAQLSDRV